MGVSGAARKGYRRFRATRDPELPQIGYDEIWRLLASFVFNRRIAPVAALAREAHVSRQAIYDCWRGHAGPFVLEALGTVLRLVSEGRLGFEQVGEAFSSENPLRWVSVLPRRKCPSGSGHCEGVLEHEQCPRSGMAAWDCPRSESYMPPPKPKPVREPVNVFNIRSIKSVLQQARTGKRLPRRYRRVVREIARFRPAARGPAAAYESQVREQGHLPSDPAPAAELCSNRHQMP
jgi:hypothetical protein